MGKLRPRWGVTACPGRPPLSPSPCRAGQPDCGGVTADDEWLRAEGLAHCPEEAAEYDAATPHRRRARRADPAVEQAPPAQAPAPLAPPADFRCYAVRDIRSIGEQSGHTTGPRSTGRLGSTGHGRASRHANHALEA